MIKPNDELFFTPYDKNFVINVANNIAIQDGINNNINFDNVNDDIKNKYIIDAQHFLIDKSNEVLLKMRIADFLGGNLNYLCKVSFLSNLFKNDIAIFFPLSSKKNLEFMSKFKSNYLIPKQTIKNRDDNIEFLREDYENGNCLTSKNKFNVIFSRRFDNLKKRCIENNLPNPNKEKVFTHFNNVLQKSNYFKCFYCKEEMRLKGEIKTKSVMDFKDLFTIEHRKPLSQGGTHESDNLVFTCMSCNQLKEDMPEDMFIEFLDKMSNDFKYKLFEFKMNKNINISSKFKYYKNEIRNCRKEIIVLKNQLKQNKIYSSQLLEKIT